MTEYDTKLISKYPAEIVKKKILLKRFTQNGNGRGNNSSQLSIGRPLSDFHGVLPAGTSIIGSSAPWWHVTLY